MRKFLTIIAFFLLLEYRVFVEKTEYSLIVAIGFIMLCAYEFFADDKPITFREAKKDGRAKVALTFGERAAASVYAIIILLSLIFGSDWGGQFAFVLIAGILGITAMSLIEQKRKKQEGTDENSHNTWMSSFTIPKLFLYLLNYLLSIQIHESMGYQSILFLSCFILYDLIDRGDKIVAKANKGQISEHEFKHYLFHRWSKYWNFFLGVWFFVALRANGAISAQYEYILLFAFMVIFFTFLMRNENHFTIKDFVTVTFFSALLAGISPLVSSVSGNEIPAYMLAALVFIAFDLCDTYFHQREFRETGLKFWSQKAVVYLLMGIYIAQVHFMMTHAMFGVDQVAASLF